MGEDNLKGPVAGNPGDISESAGWRAVFILLMLLALSFVDRQIISLLVGPIKTDLGVSDVQISLLQGFSFALLYSLCGVPFGMAVDRYSRRWVIFFGVTIWALATTASGFATDFSHLLAARFFVGMGEAALMPAAYSIISGMFRTQRLTFALAVFSVGSLIGLGSSLAIGAMVIHLAGDGVDLAGFGHLAPWQVAFVVVGLPGVFMGPLVFLFPEPPRPASAPGGVPWSQVLAFMRSRAGFFACHLIGFSIIQSLSYAKMAWTPAFLARKYGWSVANIGLALGAFWLVTGMIAILSTGRIVDWMMSRGVKDAHFRFYLWVTVFLGITGAYAYMAPTPLLYFVSVGVGAIGTNMAAIAASAVQIVTPPQMRGRVSALYLMFASLVSMTVGPSLVAVFTDYVYRDDSRIDWSMTSTVVVLAPIAFLAFLLGMKPMRRAVELAQQPPAPAASQAETSLTAAAPAKG